MSIGRESGFLEMLCDECGDDLQGSWFSYEFNDMMRDAKDAGWRSVKETDGWSHYCPKCSTSANKE